MSSLRKRRTIRGPRCAGPSRVKRAQRMVAGVAFASLFASLALPLAACGWDPSHPFERNSPVVGEAIAQLDGGDAGSASAILEEYLSTGSCSEGSIGTPLLVRARPNGGVDLGLSLFRVAEGYGQRFGDEEGDSGLTDVAKSARGGDIECARKIVRAIGGDENVPVDLRARAHYIEGNLLFLDAKYKDAVKAYDDALTLSPGMFDAGEQIGRDAAWNRAIALRRNEDQKDAGNKDASPPDASDNDSGEHGDGGQNNGDGGDSNKDSGGNNGGDGGGQPPDGGSDDRSKDGGGNDDNGPDASRPHAPDPPSQLDERILDKLENAPTVQQEAAKKQGQKHRVRVPIDK